MTLTIPANDHGQIRVFATTDNLPEAAREKTAEGLEALFGAALNPDYVDIVRLSDLGGMTLSAYIAEGYDMSPDLVDRAVVDEIKGTAILVLSRATGEQDVTLTLAPGLRHITTYSPAAQLALHEKLPDAGAEGALTDPPQRSKKSDARIGGMVAMYALLAMFALVGLMIWVGG